MESGDSTSYNTVKMYLEKMRFTSIMPIASGAFGDVLSAITPHNETVAVKIVKNNKSWKKEEVIWPSLKHPNILPLYDIIDLKEMKMKLYIMPKLPTSLDKMFRSPSFLADPDGLKRIRRWLKNSIDGLQYLHESGFVHLDIKSNNVLIDAKDSAVLCDFSGINLKNRPCKRLVAPLPYRAPECFVESEKHRLDGTAFDIWTYGLMSQHLLTENWPYPLT